MSKFLSLCFSILMTFCFAGLIQAQEKLIADSTRTERFRLARELAFSGERDKARAICYQILKENPNYHDVRILIGRIYAWDKNYMQGREELKKVLDEDFNNRDAIDAIIDLEKWSGDLLKAIFYCEYGQSFFPNDEKFLIQKIKLLLATGDEREALQSLDELLELSPSNKDGLVLLKKYKSSKMLYKANYQHDFESFRKPYKRKWHVSSFQLARRNSWGSLIAKVNLGDLVKQGEQFWSNEVAKQFELDAYPRIYAKSYAYLNYGYSPDNLFPGHRAGAELYHKLPAKFVVSGGFRFLQFDSDGGDKNVFIYTASLAKYYRSYWFSFRTYVTPKNSDISRSYWLRVRNYLRDSKNYIGLELGIGVSPDEARGNVASPDVYNYKSRKIKLSYQDELFTDRLIYLVRLGWEREEYQVDEKRNVTSLTVKLSYQF